jgi:hypothetical protein
LAGKRLNGPGGLNPGIVTMKTASGINSIQQQIQTLNIAPLLMLQYLA